MQKPFTFQTDITFRASAVAAEENPTSTVVTLELLELSDRGHSGKTTRMMAVIPKDLWARGLENFAPMLKSVIAQEVETALALRGHERAGRLVVLPTGNAILGGVLPTPLNSRPIAGMIGGLASSLGRTARVWMDHAASALSAVDGRPESDGAVEVGVGPVKFPYGPGRAARDAWFSKQNECARRHVADLQRQVESLQALADMGTQTEVQRLARIASKLSALTGAEMPDGASALRLERWICGIQDLNLRSAGVGVVRKAELATARQVAAIFYSTLGIVMPMVSEDDTVTSLAQRIAETATAEIDRRDKACDEARWRIERIASEIERVSGENFGIPVRTDPLLEDYAIRWVSRMRKKMVDSSLMKAVVLEGRFPGLREGVTTAEFLPEDQRKDPIDAFWVGFKLCEQRAAEALQRSFDAGGSALDGEGLAANAPGPHASPLLFDTVEFSWVGSGTPVTLSVMQTLDENHIVGIIEGDVASVEARIASLQFAESMKAPLRKRWVDRSATPQSRVQIDAYEFCTRRGDAKGRTCVSVALKLSPCEEPQRPNEPEPQPDPKPDDVSANKTKGFAVPDKIEILRHHPAEDLSGRVADVLFDPNNQPLRIFNSARSSSVQFVGRIEDRAGKQWLYGAISAERKLVAEAIDELLFNKLVAGETRIVRANHPSDAGLKVRFLRGEVRTNEPIDQPSVMEALVNIQLGSVEFAAFSDPRNEYLRVSNEQLGIVVRLMGRLDETDAKSKRVLRGVMHGGKDFIDVAAKQLEKLVSSMSHARIRHGEDPRDAGVEVQFMRGTARVSTPDAVGLVEASVQIEVEMLEAKDPQDDPSTVRFHCGTCEKRYTVAREKVAVKNIMIKCANCGAQLEVTPVGAVVVERGIVPTGTNETNNRPDDAATKSTESMTNAVRRIVERPMAGDWPVKGEPRLSASRQPSAHIDRTLLFRGKPVEPGSAEWTAVADRVQALDADASYSNIATHEASVQIHFEDLSNGEVVNDGAIIAILTRGDLDEDGCRSWSLLGNIEGTHEWVGKVQSKIDRLSTAKTHVLVRVRPRQGEDYTIRAQLYGTNFSAMTPSRYEFGAATCTKIHIYTTIVELKVPPSDRLIDQMRTYESDPDERAFEETHEMTRASTPKDQNQNELGLGVLFEPKDLAPVTPRSQRDPEDLARIEAQPKNLRTLVEDAHELLSRYEPSNIVMDPGYWATTKRPLLDPLLHRIRLLGDAWESAAGHRNVYAPITLEHERHEVPELLFRGKQVTPKDPEWAELVATIRVLEAQAFPLVKLTVTGPKADVGANEMVALATAIERVGPRPIKPEITLRTRGPISPEDYAAAQMRPEDQEAQAALNNVEVLLRGTDVASKEPESPAQPTDFERGETVGVIDETDAYYGYTGRVEGRDSDGKTRVRFYCHGGVSCAFPPHALEKLPRPATPPEPAIATSLQPDPSANPPITEAEANMARKLNDGHQVDMAKIYGLDHVRESSDPIKHEPPTIVLHDPKLPLSAIIDREQLAARARELVFGPGEPGANRLAALADMAAKDPQIAEDVAVVAALVDDPNALPNGD